MFTPFDTAHLTHTADRHGAADAATREANRQRRAARRAAFHAFVAQVFAQAPRHAAPVKPVTTRV
ncbi:hypothetical protein [Thetidibacter halocola]|uniref:Uncharacterized protein n=1 Tax=Thetidibacter halocola TaxID=2827239 RepID=A0A8J7WDK1_9RHOB|nr:hypothetical protein [Thetidibacter halocola]MBS0123178.1 hypothetical protein [Thetidibacter halocola]